MTLLEQLRRDEGVRYTMYFDSVNIATIGVGHRLDLPLSEAAVDQILRDDVADAEQDCAALDCWAELSEPRRGVLVNMRFNLGFRGLTAFRMLFAALDAKDYDRAAFEMLDSQWARQVGERARRLASQMREDVWR